MELNKKSYKTNTWDNKPYNFFGDYLRKKYQRSIYKLPINAGLSCPNIEKNKGCIFCSEDGSSAYNIRGIEDIRKQISHVKEKLKRKSAGYISYFQAFTNTYASVDKLKQIYDTAVDNEDILGLMIGTRPDVLPDDVLDLIASYNKKKFELWLEIGVQSFHDKSLIFLNRQHSSSDSIDAINRAAKRNINVCIHIILGIPGESWEDSMKNAEIISQLPIKGVKIHHLHVIKNTQLELMYKKSEISVLSLKEYSSLICDFIERLNPDITIHRLIGDREKETLVAPLWSLQKGSAIKAIEDEFKKRETFQGFMSDMYSQV